MQSDLADGADDPNYKDKVAECMNIRAKKIIAKLPGEQKLWEDAMGKEKKYIMYKKGYKFMLDDLEQAKTSMKGFKRGLSIFEDETMRKQLTEQSDAPVLAENNLSNNLTKVIFSDIVLKNGPQESINKNFGKEFDEQGVEYRTDYTENMNNTTFMNSLQNQIKLQTEMKIQKKMRNTHQGFGTQGA